MTIFFGFRVSSCFFLAEQLFVKFYGILVLFSFFILFVVQLLSLPNQRCNLVFEEVYDRLCV